MDDSIWALILTIFADILIFSLEFYLFSIYRTFRNKPVFMEMEGKDIKVPVFSESDTPLFKLLKGVWNVPYEEIGFYCGLEGKLYLALHKVLAQSFVVMAILGVFVLIPVYTSGNSVVDKDMNMISMAHIVENDHLMVFVLIYFFLFSVFGLFIIGYYIREVSKAYSMPSELICTINKYTVEIRGIPVNIAPIDAAHELKEILNEQFRDEVQSIYVVPNLASSHAIYLETVEAKKELLHYQEYLKYKGERALVRESACKKRDAIDFFQEKVDKLQKDLDAEIEKNKEKTAGCAYVITKSPASAIKIVHTFKPVGNHLNSENWVLTIAPSPSEINWQNLEEPKKKTLMVRILLFLGFLLFFFLLVTPSTLLQILIEIIESLGLDSIREGILNQFLPSLILLVYQSILVRNTVLFIVSREKLGNKSEETASALFKFLMVMITYIFLVPLIGLQVYSMITGAFVGDFDEWQNGIANQAAFSGLFFTIFMTHLTFLKMGSDFIQFPKIFRVKFRQMRAVNDRERLMAYEAYEFRWPYEYGVSLTALVIILSFSVAYPLILIFGITFYTARYFTAKYNLLCFYCTVKTTTGHKIPKVITSAMLVAILIFQVFTCALIFLSDSKIYFVVATSLLVFSILLFLVLYYFRDKIEAKLRNNLKLEKFEDEGIVFGEDISSYYHPLDKIRASTIFLVQDSKEKSILS